MSKSIDCTPNYMVVSKQNITDSDIKWLFEQGADHGLTAVWNDDEHRVLYVVIFNHGVGIPANIDKYVSIALKDNYKFLGFADGVPSDYFKVKIKK